MSMTNLFLFEDSRATWGYGSLEASGGWLIFRHCSWPDRTKCFPNWFLMLCAHIHFEFYGFRRHIGWCPQEVILLNVGLLNWTARWLDCWRVSLLYCIVACRLEVVRIFYRLRWFKWDASIAKYLKDPFFVLARLLQTLSMYFGRHKGTYSCQWEHVENKAIHEIFGKSKQDLYQLSAN